MEQAAKHLEYIRNHPEWVQRIIRVFDEEYEKAATDDPDLMIYSGGFFSPNDRTEMQRIRLASEIELAEEVFNFQDKRLPEMLFRYKARNYPGTLTEDEQEKWTKHCAVRLMAEDSEYLTIGKFFDRLQSLAEELQNEPAKLAILEDLKYYAESIVPYY